jgi:hypothetical protein
MARGLRPGIDCRLPKRLFNCQVSKIFMGVTVTTRLALAFLSRPGRAANRSFSNSEYELRATPIAPFTELIDTNGEWSEDGRVLGSVKTPPLPDGHVLFFPWVTGYPVLDLQTVHVGWREDDGGSSARADVEDNRSGVAWPGTFLRSMGMMVVAALLLKL